MGIQRPIRLIPLPQQLASFSESGYAVCMQPDHDGRAASGEGRHGAYPEVAREPPEVGAIVRQ